MSTSAAERSDVTITTFGYLHSNDVAPAAHLTFDLRTHFRDPHVAPELRYLTARDKAVRTAVLATPGISGVIAAAAAMVSAYLDGPIPGPVTVAVGCAGGLHRAPTVGAELASVLIALYGIPATLIHRDLDKAVVNRDERPEVMPAT